MPFLHVLIIDNEQIELEVIEGIFKEYLPDIITYTTTSGLEAIKKAKNILYDMVFLDIDMPEMNGIDTYKELQNIKGYTTVPIILMISSLNEMPYVEDILKIKGVEHIAKPIRPCILVKKIETCKQLVTEWINFRNLTTIEDELIKTEGK